MAVDLPLRGMVAHKNRVYPPHYVGFTEVTARSRVVHALLMNRTDVILEMVERAQLERPLLPEDAISYLAAMIDCLEPGYPYYADDVETLMRIGACIWQLQLEKATHA